MTNKKDMITTKYIPLGKMLKGKNFKSFDSLRKKANKIVQPHRDHWMMTVFIKNSIFVNPAVMTRREIHEIYEQNKVDIRDDADKIYRIYKEGKIIGEWDNSRLIQITKEGVIQVRIRYVVV